MNKETTTAIQLQSQLQNDFQKTSLGWVEEYLDARKSNSPEFKIEFEKILSDMVFSQTDDGFELLKKARPQSLLNAVFRASEIGASFAKREISVLPFSANKKETVNGVTTTKATGQYDLTVVVDINFQKQMILAMPNCKRFFTCEVHDGVQVISDLNTGLYIFEGINNVTKPTIGYYAVFITTDNEIYPLFMTNGEIVERAKMNPNFKDKNYVKTSSNIHYEKIVVRNLLKEIPKVSKELRSVLAYDERTVEDAEYEDLTHTGNTLEAAKKELAEQKPIEKVVEKVVKEKAPEKTVESETKSAPANDAKQSEIQSFF